MRACVLPSALVRRQWFMISIFYDEEQWASLNIFKRAGRPAAVQSDRSRVHQVLEIFYKLKKQSTGNPKSTERWALLTKTNALRVIFACSTLVRYNYIYSSEIVNPQIPHAIIFAHVIFKTAKTFFENDSVTFVSYLYTLRSISMLVTSEYGANYFS